MFIKLTLPRGALPVFYNITEIVRLQEGHGGTVVELSNGRREIVAESVETIRDLIKGQGEA